MKKLNIIIKETLIVSILPLMVLLLLLLGCCTPTRESCVYTDVGVVISSSHGETTLSFKDGNEFVIEGSYKEGSYIACSMSDEATDSRSDDIIIDTKEVL